MHLVINVLVGSCITSITPICLVYVYNPNDQAINSLLISLAIGSLLGDATFHLIPEMLGLSFNQCVMPTIALLIGMLLFLSFEQYLQIYHCGHGHGREVEVEREQETTPTNIHHHHRHANRSLGPLVVMSDIVHNLVDGLAIGTSFRASKYTGISTTIAVLLHEIPHELSDYAILGVSGYEKKQIILYSMIASSASIFGAILGALMGDIHIFKQPLQPLMLAFTAGNFLYIALADMTPELMHGHTPLGMITQNLLIALGSMVMLLLKWEFN